MNKYPNPSFEAKIVTPDKLLGKLHGIKRPLVFTNGCFDILHRGHVTYLAQAKSLGASLVVALNTDESIKRLGKGDDRPINLLINRMAVIASLQMVDYVTYFNEDTPLELILHIKPDILVKGGDWEIDTIIGSREVLAYQGRVYSIPFLHNTSTTALVNKIRDGN
jgi:D-glycero-beta-D-manno-heptose 1-phosphate adenylyltransferase